jgi:hypothetical protein
MKLVFINHVGANFRDQNLYELLFTSEDIQDVSGDDWDSCPANGSPRAPIDFIEEAYKLEIENELILIQNSASFDMDDCMQGIIALAWEADKDEYSYGSRLFFKYGETLEQIKTKLYERDIFIEKIYGKEKQPVD